MRALDHLSFEVPAGVVFGFLGPNGAGKTTAIRVLLGLVDATSGRAEVFGLDTQTRRVTGSGSGPARSSSTTGCTSDLTAFQNLDFFGRIWRMPRGATARPDPRAARRSSGSGTDGSDVVGQVEPRHEAEAGGGAGGAAPPAARLPRRAHARASTRSRVPPCGRTWRAWRLCEGVTIFLTTHNLTEAERLCALVGVIREREAGGLRPPAELRAAEVDARP